MATKTTDTDRQLDEFGVEIPTDEELAKERADQEAERIKTEQTMQLVREANATVAPLPVTLPTQGSRWSPPSGVMAEAAPVQPPTMLIGATPPMINRGGQVSTGSPLVAPPSATQGRSYMGPAMSPEQEASFMRSPGGTNINLTPGTTPDRWAAETQPSITRSPPPEMLATMKRYEAQRTIQEAVKNGTPMQDAIQLYGEGLFPSLNTATRPMTENQQSLAEHRKVLEVQAAKRVAPPVRNMVLEKAISDERSALNKTRAELAKTPPKDGTDPRIHEALYHVKKLAELNAQNQQSQPTASAPPVQAPAPKGIQVKDKSGKTWLYTGTAADPKTDKNQSHWTAQ